MLNAIQPAANAPTGSAVVARRLKAIFIGSIGNLVEWYDFYAYAAFSLYFAASFFPKDDAVTQQLNSAFIFALAFFARPIGAWLFGNLADRRGRRLSLILSVAMMCFGSLLIAAAPTYAMVGIWAPILLSFARIIQGISLGGEYGASASYIGEIADPRRRGFYSSFLYVTLIGGQLCAVLVLLALQRVFLDDAQLRAWGWRIPFVIGAGLAIVAALMRGTLQETEAFVADKREKRPSAWAFLRYPKEVLLVIGLTMGGTAAFYTFTTYMQKFLKLSVKLGDDQTTMVTAGSLLFAILLQPLYGALSDRIGRKPLLIGFGVLGVLATIPILTALQSAQSPWMALLLISGAWLYVSGYTAINAIVKAELFPTHVRATGIAVPYALTVSVFGGTAEPIALAFKQGGHEEFFYYYLTAIIAVSLLVYVFMRDTGRNSAMERRS